MHLQLAVAIISLMVSIVLKLIEWRRGMFGRKEERGDRELEQERALSALDIYKRLAGADILGTTEAELIGQSEIPAVTVRMILEEMQARGQAHFRKGRWYEKDPVVQVARWGRAVAT
jgi:hypothetical protein